MKCFVCGDVHGYWESLNYEIKRNEPDILLSVGDFGWWRPYSGMNIILPTPGCVSKTKSWTQYGIKNPKTKIYFCPGNHEHWDDLDTFPDMINEVMSNVFYMKRGATLTLPTGEIVFFMGGASSIDSNYRTPGYDWFPQENISQKDIFNLDPELKVDIVVSHTCPTLFGYKTDYQYNDPSRNALDVVYEMYHPKKWIFGHFHNYECGIFNNCKWISLPCSPSPLHMINISEV